MKAAHILFILSLSTSVSFGQDKTPVLSETGTIDTEQIARDEPRLAESDAVSDDVISQKRKRVRKTKKMPAIAESESVEIEPDSPTIDH